MELKKRLLNYFKECYFVKPCFITVGHISRLCIDAGFVKDVWTKELESLVREGRLESSGSSFRYAPIITRFEHNNEEYELIE